MAIDAKTKETLILVGVFGFLTISLMTGRLVMRKYRQQKFILSDYLTGLCIVLMFGRAAFVTVVLLWKNNNGLTPIEAAELSETEISQRIVGSKLTMVNRAEYNTYLWIQKAVVLLLIERILERLDYTDWIIRIYWAILLGTFIAVQTTTFSECDPVHLYWQIVPDPGPCINANVQLVTLVGSNVATDAMLIMLPMPWLLSVNRSWGQRLQLVALFSIGFLLIAIAIVRLPYYATSTAQVNRNTWGSVEQFFAAVVANVPTLFSLRRHRDEDTGPYWSYNSGEPTSGRRAAHTGFTQFDEDSNVNDITITRSFDVGYEMANRTQEIENKSPAQTEQSKLESKEQMV